MVLQHHMHTHSICGTEQLTPAAHVGLPIERLTQAPGKRFKNKTNIEKSTELVFSKQTEPVEDSLQNFT